MAMINSVLTKAKTAVINARTAAAIASSASLSAYAVNTCNTVENAYDIADDAAQASFIAEIVACEAETAAKALEDAIEEEKQVKLTGNLHLIESAKFTRMVKQIDAVKSVRDANAAASIALATAKAITG
jgi:hypothetical protein